ncbi:MAG: ABC transporter ATP-binding protein, partial [Pseudomonadota bacterium]
MSKVKLRLLNISKQFDHIHAVDGFSQDIMDGEAVALLGPSGCGKTTLLRIIAGFFAPDQGSILMDGVEITSPTRFIPPNKRNMSMVFQSYALWPNRTMFENVAYGLKLRKIQPDQIKAMVDEVLVLVGMTGRECCYPSELSGGQQQRVALARALVVKPDILLLDEPLSNLDAKLRVRMRDDIREIQKKSGITFVYVTHDQNEAMAIADRIVLMQSGKIIQVGSAQNLYQEPNCKFVANFIGTGNHLDGFIDNDDEEENMLVLTTEHGEKIYAINRSTAGPERQKNKKALAFIRPEAISLKRGKFANDKNTFSGRVKKQKYYGNLVEYEIQTEHRALLVQSNPKELYPEGMDIFL